MASKLRRAYLAIKYHPDHRNRGLIERISSALSDSGWQTTCIARDVEKWGEIHLSSQALMQRSFAEIDRCQMLIIELSEKGVGIGIEAGYAYAHHIPIMVILPQDSDLSNTLEGIADQILTYANEEELSDGLRQFFAHE